MAFLKVMHPVWLPGMMHTGRESETF